VITNKRVRHVLLPNIRNKELEERMKTMAHGIISGPLRTYHFRSQLMVSLFKWLWDLVVEPIWNILREEFRTLGDPRIWWMRTSSLALAPIHVAGTFSLQAQESGFNKVISSYIPTLKALKYSREKLRG
jgi:hypothetical protein